MTIHPILARPAIACLVTLLSLTPVPLSAATATTTFTVRLVLQNDCAITASDLDFGTRTALASNVDATSTVGVTCTNGAAYNVGLDAGNVPLSTTLLRLLSNGSNVLNFQMYRDSARTQTWGNIIGLDTASGTGTGSLQNLTVYGRVPSQPVLAAGTYQ